MMSIKNFCARNDTCRQRAYDAINDGSLEAVKFGRRTLISPEAEQRWRERLPRISARRSQG